MTKDDIKNAKPVVGKRNHFQPVDELIDAYINYLPEHLRTQLRPVLRGSLEIYYVKP